MNNYFTSESVTEGHPDKVCDQISDALLDAFLEQDKKSRVAVETFALTGQVVVGGEVTTEGWVNVPDVVRSVIKRIGYDRTSLGFNYDCGIMSAINSQSPDIAMGVDNGGAGDQGMMFGGAVNETESMMPLPIEMAHFITRWLTTQRKTGHYKWMRPDGKSQVTVPYVNGRPAITGQWTFVISTQHSPEISCEEIKHTIIEDLVPVFCETFKLPKEVMKHAIFHVNPTGKFVIGGPHGDSGLTGRKIIVDTYGGYFRHGGGAFSGKDPTKVDRSATYMARHIAKNIVANQLAEYAEVQLSYAIGVAEPVSVLVETKGSHKMSPYELTELIRRKFDLTPRGIIGYLELLDIKYEDIAAYGHFGMNAEKKPWEQLVNLK